MQMDCEWTEAEWNLLSNLYKDNISNVGPLKMYDSVNTLWDSIVKRMNSIFSTQRTRVECTKQFNMLSQSKQKCSYLSDNKSTEEDVQIKRPAIDFKDCVDPLQSSTTILQDTLIGIASFNERNQERRQKEIVKLFTRFMRKSNGKRIIRRHPASSATNRSKHFKKADQCNNNERKQRISFETKSLARDCFIGAYTEGSAPTIAECKVDQKQELLAMRQQMLELQRLKMEERERRSTSLSKSQKIDNY